MCGIKIGTLTDIKWGRRPGIKSECLRVQIGPGRKRLPRGMMRDLFEAGLNEAAGSLAASYGALVVREER